MFRVVLGGAAVPPVVVALLVRQPHRRHRPVRLEALAPPVDPAGADDLGPRRSRVEREHRRAPRGHVDAEHRAADVVHVVVVPVVGRAHRDDRLEGRWCPRCQLQGVEPAPRDAEHADGARRPLLLGEPGDHGLAVDGAPARCTRRRRTRRTNRCPGCRPGPTRTRAGRTRGAARSRGARSSRRAGTAGTRAGRAPDRRGDAGAQIRVCSRTPSGIGIHSSRTVTPSGSEPASPMAVKVAGVAPSVMRPPSCGCGVRRRGRSSPRRASSAAPRRRRRAASVLPGSSVAASSVDVYGWFGPVKTRSVGPISTIRPPVITATRSATPRTTARSWLMNRQLSPRSRCRSARSARIPACTCTSSAVVISSAITSDGPAARARAIPTRCRCPPDSWAGSRSANSGPRPTWVSSSPTRCREDDAREQLERTRDGRAHGAPRVERRVGVLEHELHRAPQRRASVRRSARAGRRSSCRRRR